jgi:hypothetical protein
VLRRVVVRRGKEVDDHGDHPDGDAAELDDELDRLLRQGG